MSVACRHSRVPPRLLRAARGVLDEVVDALLVGLEVHEYRQDGLAPFFVLSSLPSCMPTVEGMLLWHNVHWLLQALVLLHGFELVLGVVSLINKALVAGAGVLNRILHVLERLLSMQRRTLFMLLLGRRVLSILLLILPPALAFEFRLDHGRAGLSTLGPRVPDHNCFFILRKNVIRAEIVLDFYIVIFHVILDL